MEEQQQEPTNPQVIAAAGSAAAVLAGLAIQAGRRRRARRPVTLAERLPKQAEALADTARERGRQATEDWTAAMDARARQAAAAGRKQLPKLRAAERKALKEAEQLRRQAKVIVDREARRGAKASKKARKRGKDSAVTARSLAAGAAALGLTRAEDVVETGSALMSDVRKEWPKLKKTVEKEVLPPVRDTALGLVGEAIGLWNEGRDRAADVTGGDLSKTASHALDVAAAQGERARDASNVVAERAAELGDRARDASRRTADATVETSKDTGALLFWAGAAAALVFYAVLTPERRDQVARTVAVVSTEVQELVKDLQGYDDEF